MNNTGFTNGYRYGVEYPTNGKKPDLPDDVIIRLSAPMCRGALSVFAGSAMYAAKGATFKITDTRYKPADTSYLNEAVVKDSLTDDWYDYTNQKALRLPPVGAECLTWFDDGKECWQKCKVLALSPYEQDHMAVSLIGRYDRKLIWSQDFKPLDWNRKAEAERRRIMDAACKYLGIHLLDTFQDLYDAGFLRMPEDK